MAAESLLIKENGTFRKKNGFTITGNLLTRDKSLSLKAKGLYLLISSYITLDSMNLNKDFIFNKCQEGRKSFETAWTELKNKGYLKVYMKPSSNGWTVEYELKDEADMGEHTFYLNMKGEITSTNLNRKKEIDRYPQKGSNAKGSIANGSNANGSIAKGVNNINTINKTNYNTINNTQSINLENSKDMIDEIDYINGKSQAHFNLVIEKETPDMVTYEFYKKIISENISYRHMKEKFPYELILDDILEIMVEVVASNKKTIRVNGEDKSKDIVKSTFLKLNNGHIEYVLESMNNNTIKANNIKSYLITALYNAPKTINLYYSNLVNHDMANYF